MTQFERAHNYLLNKPEATHSFPFGEEIYVYKVKNKMFAALAIGKAGKGDGDKRDWWLNLKCDPQEAMMLRDIFESVIPGYHMNKKHWNTVILDGSIPQGEIERMIDSSYMLVVDKMTKKDKASILVHLES
ncbi:MmcQ/YjbR family DNA-binding protein [Candidatus Enterovibrio escicola]|uniref:MmcQ/YjbR family DNA-binding protein n=1 Tax=Candidatus Enterovibrio escicola TaxID=1927127 RepID=UPI001237DAC1|nr:MmcQ/YjbR family DNA-binding protein [Candidatus Enterovibrio escacola]